MIPWDLKKALEKYETSKTSHDVASSRKEIAQQKVTVLKRRIAMIGTGKDGMFL